MTKLPADFCEPEPFDSVGDILREVDDRLFFWRIQLLSLTTRFLGGDSDWPSCEVSSLLADDLVSVLSDSVEGGLVLFRFWRIFIRTRSSSVTLSKSSPSKATSLGSVAAYCGFPWPIGTAWVRCHSWTRSFTPPGCCSFRTAPCRISWRISARAASMLCLRFRSAATRSADWRPRKKSDSSVGSGFLELERMRLPWPLLWTCPAAAGAVFGASPGLVDVFATGVFGVFGVSA